MNPLFWLIPVFLILILIGITIWFYLRKRKAKSRQKNEELEEVLADFNMAERLFSDSLKGGSENDKGPNPYTILWQIAKSKRRTYQGIGNGIEYPSVSNVSSGPDSIQRPAVEAASNYEPESYQYKRRDNESIRRKRGLFRRR